MVVTAGVAVSKIASLLCLVTQRVGRKEWGLVRLLAQWLQVLRELRGKLSGWSRARSATGPVPLPPRLISQSKSGADSVLEGEWTLPLSEDRHPCSVRRHCGAAGER